MKKVIFTATILLFLLGIACKPLNDVLEGVTFFIGTDFIEHPLSIQFVNANGAASDQPRDLTVTISGPDADLLFSLFGESQLRADGNILNVAVEKSTTASATAPLEFTVSASAPGYLPVERRFRITDPEIFRMETVTMAQLNNLPPGVSRRNLSIDVPAGGTGSIINFATPYTNGKTERALVSIPADTRLFDANGQEVTGAVNIDLIHFDTRQWQGRQALPAGLDVDDAIDQGNSLGGGSFHTVGNVRLTMEAGGVAVRSFSQPVDVFVEVADDVLNPFTGSFLSQNNSVPIWSRQSGTRVWDREGNARIIPINGKLTATYEQDHLSDWTMSWFLIDRCDTPTALSFASNLAQEEASEYHMLEIDVMSTRGTVLRKYIRLAQLYEGQQIFLYDVPSTGGLVNGLRVKVYEGYSFFCGADPVFTSPTRANVCVDYNFSLGDILRPPSGKNLIPATMTFRARCDQSDEDPLALLPTAAIFFRNTQADCNEPYRLMATFENGESSFQQLRRGDRYDLLVAAGGLYREYRNVTIPEEDARLELFDQANSFIDAMEFEYRANQLFIRYEEVELPDDVCATWREVF